MTNDQTPELILTGERTLPGIPEENYWFQRHVVAYRYAAGLTAGMNVLDAGCGEGYGTAILAERAASVVGLDLEAAVIDHATATYPGIRFERGDLAALPFADGALDAVVTLQVVEHVPSPRDFVVECARVLRPGGLLIMSTPNRLTFSPEGIRNPFHTIEFAPAELRALLTPRFDVVTLAGTFHGPRIRRGELLRRQSFPERLIRTPVPEWPPRLKRVVSTVTPEDFRIREHAIDRSLDLVAVGARR